MNESGYWRSLSEVAARRVNNGHDVDEFFPGASEWPGGLSRREFLRLTGASLALAGFTSCTKQPVEKIVPYVKQPEEVIPGKPVIFATATQFGGFGQGLLVTSYEGRPTKVEGNPDHPASLGATTVWAQADILDLYDPDRAQTVTTAGAIKTTDDFWNALSRALQPIQANAGASLRILTESITSPTLLAQLDDVLKKLPSARWSVWDPLNRDNVISAETMCDFSKAKVVVALDSDFLYAHPFALRYARDFANARRVIEPGGARMNRLYAAEPTPTITGSNADHRIPVEAGQILPLVRAIESALRSGGSTSAGIAQDWVRTVVADLRANRGAGVVIAGESQPPEVHSVVARINQALGNNGVTVLPAPPVPLPENRIALRELVADMGRGVVELLIILGGNPIYDAPADLDFGSAFEQVKLRVHHSTQFNETSRRSHWHVPASHFLESWSDTRAFDGTISIVQPLIEPMYSGVSTHQVLDALLGQSPRTAYEIVRSRWEAPNRGPEFEAKWREALSAGVVRELTPPAFDFAIATRRVPEGSTSSPERSPTNLEVLFKPDVSVRDGRYANNGWLQELPRQFSKLVWDNAALISAQLAHQEKLENGDVVELVFGNRTISAPVWIQPGQAANSVTLPLGYGREIAGTIGRGVGFNAYALRTSNALWFADGLKLRKTGRKYSLVSTQQHHSVGDRGILHDGTLDEFHSNPNFARKAGQLPAADDTLYNPEEFPYRGYKWAMVVDLNTCIGCHACTIACQAENNIPVVGKQQVAVHREMHWIRVDTYYSGETDRPQFTHQPVPCMHCESAPCELVCPVAATAHDSEGLNLQIYNRCVGTRYCSNNCPYKVRRFNFLEYNNKLSPSVKLIKNPDVTVRSRGVMEKCTYCIQRINAARIKSELEQRTIRDGEAVPACAQVCPAGAITFGNMNDPNSAIARLKKSPLNYWMLGQLNTRPRTSFLAKLRNRNPDLKLS